MTDAAKELRKEAIRYGGIPHVPADLNLDEATRELARSLTQEAESAPTGTPQYEGAVYKLHRLVEELQSQLPIDTEMGPIVGRHEFQDETGQFRIQEWDQLGHVAEVEIDASEAEQAAATMKLRIDERAAVRADLQEVARIQELVATISDPIAQEELRTRATELADKAQARLDALREAVPPEEWARYGLGQGPVLSDQERQAIAMAKSQEIDSLASVWPTLTPEQQQTVIKLVPPETSGWLEALIRKAEAEEGVE